MKENPRVGVAAIILQDHKVLMGKRKNAHGEGCWAFPGGHLEHGESIEECARREVKEETGLNVQNIRIETFTNDIFVEEEKHYITIFIVCEYESGELQLNEPHKCEEWVWVEWNEFPEPLFLPVKNLLKKGFGGTEGF